MNGLGRRFLSVASWPQGDGENEGKRDAARQSVCRRRAGAVRDCLSRAAPLFTQPRPVFEPLFDLALEAAFRRVVELTPAERLREVTLPGEGIRRVVIVFVARAVAFITHEARWRIEDVLGRQQRAALFDRP